MNRRFLFLAALITAPIVLRADSAATSGLIAPGPAPVTTTKPHLGPYRWFRRATLAASCVAGTALDSWALHRIASNPDVVLSGPFIHNGKPEYGELIGIGAGLCGASAFMQERHVFARRETRGLDLTYSFENLAVAGIMGWQTTRLLSLSDQATAAAQRAQPGTLAVGAAVR